MVSAGQNGGVWCGDGSPSSFNQSDPRIVEELRFHGVSCYTGELVFKDNYTTSPEGWSCRTSPNSGDVIRSSVKTSPSDVVW